VDPNLEAVHSFGRTASGPAFFCARVYEPATKGKVILQGVNYASGGAGILDFTGYAFVSRDTRYWIVFLSCCLWNIESSQELNLHEFLIFSALLGF
jgi:hypothetical protein